MSGRIEKTRGTINVPLRVIPNNVNTTTNRAARTAPKTTPTSRVNISEATFD